MRQKGFVRASKLTACIVTLLTMTVIASGQETPTFKYVIPRFTSSSGGEVVLSNLSSGAVTAAVILRGPAGSKLSEIAVKIPAASQKRLDSTSLPAVEGSLVVNSSAPLSLTATVANSRGAFESVGPAADSTNSVIPFFSGAAGTMDLTLVNTDNIQSGAIVLAYGRDGVP